MWQDLKFALRTLRKNPGFSLVAVLALALGIGANSAIFSVVDALVLRPLPFPHAEQLVTVRNHVGQFPQPGPLSWLDFTDFRAQAHTLSQLAAYRSDTFIMTGRKQPVFLNGTCGTANLLNVAGVPPLLGRTFAEGEDTPGKSQVIVLSFELWKKQFAGDPAIVGQTVTLDGLPFTIIGVMPKGFRFPLDDNQAEMWAPMPHGNWDIELRDKRGAHYLGTIGRLAPGATLPQARAEVATIQGRLAQQYPQANLGRQALVDSEQERLTGELRPAMLILLGAVGFVLLIACANVANLLLARATVRQREIAIRTALGAGRARVVRQMLTESVILAILGGGLGLVLALWGLDALVAVIPQDVPRPYQIGLDGRVMFYTMGISIVTGLLFGLVPALHAVRGSVNQALAGNRTVVHGRTRARSALLVGEIALALLLLVGAGLTLRSFAHLVRVDPGFNPNNMLTFALVLPDSKYKEDDQQRVFYKQLFPRLQQVPGVESAAVAIPMPYTNSNMDLAFTLDDRPEPPPDKMFDADIHMVSAGYFEMMGIHKITGRTFEARDDDGKAPPVMVINEALARTYWPNGGALGRHLTTGLGRKVAFEIVGVVADVRRGLDKEARPAIYMPFAVMPLQFMFVAVRGPNPKALERALTAEVEAVDADLPVTNVKTMDELMADSLAQRRVVMVLLAIFAVLALVLASVGIYGVMSYTVTQRTRELGIRMALGAQQAQVRKMVVREGLLLALVGVGIGLAGAFALTRVMKSLLYGVSATDPLTFVGIAALLVAVALAASFLPARRATRVDPMIALRGE
jgi:putative ABC transport system permease protein